MIEEENVEKENPNTLLLSGKEFLNNLKEGEGVRYVVIVKPKEDKTSTQVPIPIGVQQLLV